MSDFDPWNPKPEISFHAMHDRYSKTLNNQCVYISGQMTSGLRQALAKKWAKKEPAFLSSNRMRLNVDELRFVRDTIQLAFPDDRIFAPCELDEDFPGLPAVGWGQDEFNTFWKQFIRKHVKRVVFTPGWQYSRGGAWEGYIATLQQLPRLEFDNPGTNMDDSTFKRRIEDAITTLKGLGDRTDIHEGILKALNDQPPLKVAA